MSKTRVTIRGLMASRDAGHGSMTAEFSLEALQIIDVPATAHLHVSEAGTVMIGFDAEKDGEGWKYGRQVTYPAWRVVEVETTHE